MPLRERTFTDFALSGFTFSFPRGFLPCLFERELSILTPEGFYHVSSKRTFTDITLSCFPFTLNPQQFCPPRTFYFIFVMRGCVDSWASTYKWFRLLAFDRRYFKVTKSKEGYYRHSNLYQSILMVPGLSDDNSRSLIWQTCVENHLESSRKRIKKLSLNLRGMRLIYSGAHL